jgi:hypothetical protein
VRYRKQTNTGRPASEQQWRPSGHRACMHSCRHMGAYGRYSVCVRACVWVCVPDRINPSGVIVCEHSTPNPAHITVPNHHRVQHCTVETERRPESYSEPINDRVALKRHLREPKSQEHRMSWWKGECEHTHVALLLLTMAMEMHPNAERMMWLNRANEGDSDTAVIAPEWCPVQPLCLQANTATGDQRHSEGLRAWSWGQNESPRPSAPGQQSTFSILTPWVHHELGPATRGSCVSCSTQNAKFTEQRQMRTDCMSTHLPLPKEEKIADVGIKRWRVWVGPSHLDKRHVGDVNVDRVRADPRRCPEPPQSTIACSFCRHQEHRILHPRVVPVEKHRAITTRGVGSVRGCHRHEAD